MEGTRRADEPRFTDRFSWENWIEPNKTRWAAQREVVGEFLGAEEDEEKGPKVLLIGAGQSGRY